MCINFLKMLVKRRAIDDFTSNCLYFGVTINFELILWISAINDSSSINIWLKLCISFWGMHYVSVSEGVLYLRRRIDKFQLLHHREDMCESMIASSRERVLTWSRRPMNSSACVCWMAAQSQLSMHMCDVSRNIPVGDSFNAPVGYYPRSQYFGPP